MNTFILTNYQLIFPYCTPSVIGYIPFLNHAERSLTLTLAAFFFFTQKMYSCKLFALFTSLLDLANIYLLFFCCRSNNANNFIHSKTSISSHVVPSGVFVCGRIWYYPMTISISNSIINECSLRIRNVDSWQITG